MQEELPCLGNNALYLKNNILAPKLPGFINKTQTLLVSHTQNPALVAKGMCLVPDLS
jgi:hypothetical protein